MSAGPTGGTSPAEEVVQRLTATTHTVATAESLTGGLLCAALVAVPGASAVLRGGVVAYAADVKTGVLGVPPDVVSRHGTVAPGTATAMAEGARSLLGSDWAVATTGVAGPDEVEGKPVGTVHVAVAGPYGGSTVRIRSQGGREQVREAAVDAALRLLRDQLPA
ncbi:MAG: competence protein [Nocardioidaceae bacterium]|nr:competence protein [Nocardioidaceae bacterium]